MDNMYLYNLKKVRNYQEIITTRNEEIYNLIDKVSMLLWKQDDDLKTVNKEIGRIVEDMEADRRSEDEYHNKGEIR